MPQKDVAALFQSIGYTRTAAGRITKTFIRYGRLLDIESVPFEKTLPVIDRVFLIQPITDSQWFGSPNGEIFKPGPIFVADAFMYYYYDDRGIGYETLPVPRDEADIRELFEPWYRDNSHDVIAALMWLSKDASLVVRSWDRKGIPNALAWGIGKPETKEYQRQHPKFIAAFVAAKRAEVATGISVQAALQRGCNETENTPANCQARMENRIQEHQERQKKLREAILKVKAEMEYQ